MTIESSSGFTLIELMVVIIIASIIALSAVPSLTDTVQRNRVESAQRDLVRDMAFARQETMARNTYVSICSSLDGVVCSGATDWSGGWLVFVDAPDGSAGKTVGVIDADEEVLRVHGELSGADALESTVQFVQFGGRGSLQQPESGSPIFEVCAPENNHVRIVALLRSGRGVVVDDAEVGATETISGVDVDVGCS